MKIIELTPEQTSIFPSIVDKFVRLGLSTQPLNQPKAIEAVNLAYQCGGLDKPQEIIFVKSPIAGHVLAKNLKKSQDDIYFINCGYNFAYLARYYTFQQLGFTEETKPLAGLFALAEECGPIWTFENLCIVSERPTFIVLNKQDKLHNFKGPAITWNDGYYQYWINGKFIHPNIGKRLVWYLNHRKSSNQPKFILEKELNKDYLKLDNQVKVIDNIYHNILRQAMTQINNQINGQIMSQTYNQIWMLVLNNVIEYRNIL